MVMLDTVFDLSGLLFLLTLIHGFGSPSQNLVQTIPIYPNHFGNCLKTMRVNL